jgi:hypothetical protein
LNIISIVGFGVGVVLRSENSEVQPGKYIYGGNFRTCVNPLGIILNDFASSAHQEYFVLGGMTGSGMSGFIFLEKNPDLPWTVFVGAAGMPGTEIYSCPSKT